ncbi:helix-turn-helix domain-containing protein [Acuticoccus sp. M5D2P5]|uniref:helix-turn-helix domain-containing protein n=1 Tax=Acuticoccus kalidii TaxID=2910977 RepID=UPI001F27C703|nr:helix-turn-helix domain-containing protein [Acuticoccus kalidii]
MTGEQLKAWRKELGWSQGELADRLGLKRRIVQYYEHGKRNGKSVAIPKAVSLACYSLTCGLADFDGKLTDLPMQPVEAELVR